MNIKFTNMDIVDANIVFSREYLTKARVVKDKDRLLKLLVLAQKSITNAINQIDKNVHVGDKPARMKSKKI